MVNPEKQTRLVGTIMALQRQTHMTSTSLRAPQSLAFFDPDVLRHSWIGSVYR